MPRQHPDIDEKELTGLAVWTIGHSTREWEEFFSLLQAHKIECVADIRQFPGSRKYPHFNGEPLARGLRQNRIAYLPIPELGGRRKPHPESPNSAWRNEAFRGYADFMATEEYQVGRVRLIETARRVRTALLCAEAVWWRCHRALVADDLKVSGAKVFHILSGAKATEHPYTSAAHVVGGRLSYAGGSNK